MGYIQTRSPISKAEMENLFETLRAVKKANIDGVVLSNIVRTCHECGLKKGELIDLCIEDVSQGGKVKDLIKVGDSTYSLSERAKIIIQDHIDYLKEKGYPRYPSKPLFPNKNNKRYTPKTLDNHLKEAQDA